MESKKENNIVYHYTSVNSFYNIIKSKKLWLTHHISSNDKTELSLKKDDFNKILKDIINAENIEFNNCFDKSDIEDLIKSSEKISIAQKDKIVYSTFGISFSEERDDLFNWSMYSDNAKGISFAVNLNIMDKAFESFELSTLSLLIHKEKLCYSDNKKYKRIYDEIISTLRELDEKTSFEDYKQQDIKDRISKSIIWKYVFDKIRYIYKNKKFQPEKEVRLFFHEELSIKPINILSEDNGFIDIISIEEDALKKVGLHHSQKSSYTSNGKIRNIYEFDFYSICTFSSALLSEFIPEVFIGPKCEMDSLELKEFLEENGFNKTKVTKSEIPLR